LTDSTSLNRLLPVLFIDFITFLAIIAPLSHV
jgi:hypothetical protein